MLFVLSLQEEAGDHALCPIGEVGHAFRPLPAGRGRGPRALPYWGGGACFWSSPCRERQGTTLFALLGRWGMLFVLSLQGEAGSREAGPAVRGASVIWLLTGVLRQLLPDWGDNRGHAAQILHCI
jgi:hypothetical protein